MPNLLKRGEAWLAGMRTEYASDDVHFVRKGGAAVVVRAEKGKSVFAAEGEDGVAAEFQTVDWIVPAAELLVDGVAVEPRAGDRFVVGGLEAGEVYEVAKEPGGTCWRWSDPQNMTRRRVHTQHVGRMPDP